MKTLNDELRQSIDNLKHLSDDDAKKLLNETVNTYGHEITAYAMGIKTSSLYVYLMNSKIVFDKNNLLLAVKVLTEIYNNK